MPEHFPVAELRSDKDPLKALALDFPPCKELEQRYIRLVLEHRLQQD